MLWAKIKILPGSIIKDFAGSLVMTYLFIHDIYFVQEIALKIDVRLNTVIQSPTIQNQKTNVYARAYYDRQNK